MSVFISKFIVECIKNGNRNSSDICFIAEQEIKEIDEKIKKIERLKMRKLDLRSVIKTLSSKTEKKAGTIFDFTVSVDKLDKQFLEICIKVCDYMENKDTAIPREIMDSISSIEENRLVYGAIKWLLQNSILNRTEDEHRFILKGKKWQNRPR